MQEHESDSRYRQTSSQYPVSLVPKAETRIAIVLFDGFSVTDVGLIVEVFHRANLAVQKTSPQREGRPFFVTVLSVRGGYVVDSLSIQVWTESIHDRSLERFDGAFVIGGRSASCAADDPFVVDRLRNFLTTAADIKWHCGGKLRAAVRLSGMGTAPAAAPPFDSLTKGRGGRATLRMFPRDQGANSTLAAALSFVKSDLRTRIESQMLQRMRSLLVGVGEAGAVERDEMDRTDPISAAARWLRENHNRSVSMAQAAEVAGMTERTFLRRFSAEMAVTPSEYLLGFRLEVACRLLVETDLPVDKIARRCGMGGGERLSRAFRSRLSMTPTEYRAAERHSKRQVQTDAR